MKGMIVVYMLVPYLILTECQLTKTQGENQTVSDSDKLSLNDFRKLQHLVYQLNSTVSRLQWAKRDDILHTSFLALAKTSHSYSNMEIIKFPEVKHSVAPPDYGYDAAISFYRCPFNGTYVFGFGITTQTANHNRFSILKEGKTIVSAQAYDASGYQGLSTMAITTCKKGEDVWVANTGGHTTGIYNTEQGVNHFTGYRIA